MNEFSNNTTFNGVRVYSLDRNSMVNVVPPHAIGFSIRPANLGDQYSLVPASFRTGNPPSAGQPEWFMNVNSSSVAGRVETQVFVRRFHFFFSSRRRHTSYWRDWSSDVCSSDLASWSGDRLRQTGPCWRSRSPLQEASSPAAIPPAPSSPSLWASPSSRPTATRAWSSRSEERRVGKECRCGGSAYPLQDRGESSR